MLEMDVDRVRASRVGLEGQGAVLMEERRGDFTWTLGWRSPWQGCVWDGR